MLADVASALEQLALYDDALAAGWQRILDSDDVAAMGLSRGDLTGDAADDEPLTEANKGAALLAGCRARLLTSRRAGLVALRHGLVDCVGWTHHLLIFRTSELEAVLYGTAHIDGAALWANMLVEYDEDEAAAAAAAPAEAEARGRVAADLERLVCDGLPEASLERLLHFCTGLRALPATGALQPHISVRIDTSGGADATALPRGMTCARELHLPPYADAETLARKLATALEHGGDGFQLT